MSISPEDGGQRTMTVQGHGIVKETPDRIFLSLGVRGFAEGYADAVAELNGRVEALRRDLDGAGIERASLKSTNFSVEERTRWVYPDDDVDEETRRRRRGRSPRHDEEGEEIFLGFLAHHDLRLELPIDRSLVNAAFERIASSGSDPKIRIAFGLSDERAYGLKARVVASAVEDAARSAQAMAEAAGVTLGEIVRVEYGELELTIRSHSMAYEMDVMASRTYESVPDLNPEDLTSSDKVTVVWRLVDRTYD